MVMITREALNRLHLRCLRPHRYDPITCLHLDASQSFLRVKKKKIKSTYLSASGKIYPHYLFLCAMDIINLKNILGKDILFYCEKLIEGNLERIHIFILIYIQHLYSYFRERIDRREKSVKRIIPLPVTTGSSSTAFRIHQQA